MDHGRRTMVANFFPRIFNEIAGQKNKIQIPFH
jgi:hypothetical protein